MSTAEFVSVILLMCGNGKGDADFDCVDYYNNCVINKSITIEMKNIQACKDDYTKGVERIKKLKEEN